MVYSKVELERLLVEIQDDILSLASMVEDAVVKSIEALKHRDLQLSRKVIEGDTAIDRMRYAIEERCIQIVALHQPMATDLRTLVAFLYIADELERMGDYAEGIGKVSLLMGDQPPLKPLIDIPRMADKALAMMREVMEALVARDAAQAREVIEQDDEVDALYDQVFRELITYMISDPRTIDRASYLTWVAHNLERLADRSTNLAERVIFLVTGELPHS